MLRPASPALAAALAGGVELWSADLFTFGLVDGVTIFNWTSWDSDLAYESAAYSSKAPWLTRSKWNVSNTMEVPSLTVTLRALNAGFNGGANIKTQIHNGLFDGATFLFSRAFMTTPGDASALGAVELFGGNVAGIDLIGTQATITAKGKVNKLDQYAPRNIYQVGCNHAFCDIGCTLSRSAFTASFTVGAGATPLFIPWSGSPPGNAALYLHGTMTLTGGVGAGQSRTVVAANSSGLTLAYPLYIVPGAGDAFTGFQGCDLTAGIVSPSGQSCSDHDNIQNYRGFPFVPPPNMAY